MAELNIEKIAAAGLAVVDAHGVSGFTMRAVADALGVTPMALYHHVKDKAALATLVVEAAGREVPLPGPTGDWREDLWAMAAWARRSTLAHPSAGRLRSAYRVWTPAILHMTERWMALWQQSGLPMDAALSAGRMSSKAINGLMEQELAWRHTQPPDESLLKWLPSARLAFDPKHDREAEFEMVARALIDGLHARLAGPQSARAKPKR